MLSLFVRLTAVTIVSVIATACGSSSPSLSNQLPTAPSAASPVNVAGAWSGTIANPNNNAVPVQMTLTQDGTTVSGSVVISGKGPDGPITFNGTVAGSVSGSQVTATVTIPAGNYAMFGASACSATGTGTYSVSASSLSGQINETFDPSCVGTIVDTPTRSEQLSMNKQ
jgi:hypothetical protein